MNARVSTGSSACPSPGFSSNDQITKGDNEVHSRRQLLVLPLKIWSTEVKQWKSKAEHEIKLKNTSPILYVSSKQKMHSENRWWNFDRHQQKISIANELQKTFLTTSKSEITGEVLRKTWGVTSNILWKSVRCFYGQNKFAYCTKCAFARKKVGCRAVAREALDHIEPSLARQRGS